MDVGDTHDEAIFGSLFVYLYIRIISRELFKEQHSLRGYTRFEVVVMQLRKTHALRLTLVRPVT